MERIIRFEEGDKYICRRNRLERDEICQSVSL